MASPVIAEFRNQWLPYATVSGLNRLLQLLEQGSPMLIHGGFAKSCATGCLATHLAWHHPKTSHLNDEAGIRWLTRVAGLNPATSNVILAWDRNGMADWELRGELIRAIREELQTRESASESCDADELQLCWS